MVDVRSENEAQLLQLDNLFAGDYTIVHEMTYANGTEVRTYNFNFLQLPSKLYTGGIHYELGECRTLWGERERVHAGAEFAWNSCMTLC